MKKPTYLLSLILLFSGLALFAQEKAKKEPQTWEEKAAERFKDNPTAEAKAAIEAAVPTPTKEPKKDRKVLVFYRCEGFIHTSIPFCNYAMQQIGEKTNAFSVDLSDQYDVFTKDNLAQYDAIIFNNTTHLSPSNDQRAAILDFINSGKGIVGFHAASDSFGTWDEGIKMMGGIFDGHPWTAGGTWAFKLDDPNHILNAAFKEKGFWHQDEIYMYKVENFQGRDKLRVLLSLDMSQPANMKAAENERWKDKEQFANGAGQADIPVTWIREIGKGRLFYTNLGHRDETFSNATVLQHMLDGIQYAMGDLDAEAAPSSKVKTTPALAPEETQ